MTWQDIVTNLMTWHPGVTNFISFDLQLKKLLSSFIIGYNLTKLFFQVRHMMYFVNLRMQEWTLSVHIIYFKI